MHTDKPSGIKCQLNEEPNVYFQNHSTNNHSSQNTSPTAQLKFTSEENAIIYLWRNTIKVMDEKRAIMFTIIAVVVIGVFLAFTIDLALFAIVQSQKQLTSADIVEEFAKHVMPLHGNLTVLKS